MIEPIVFEPVRMKSTGDCVIACLAMLTGRHYSDVMFHAPKRWSPGDEGLSSRQAQNIAKRLGFKLEYFDILHHRHWLDDHTGVGILWLDHPQQDHTVMYAKGTVYDPAKDLHWTDVDAFAAQGKYTVEGLLWRTK